MGLYKRKNVWWMSFCHNNRQYQRSTGTSNKQIAQKIYDTVKAKIALNQWVPEMQTEEKKEYTFSELVEKYKDWSAGRHRSEARKYSIAKLDRIFGSYRLEDITMQAVEQFQSDLLKQGLKAGGVNRQVSLLKAMITKAVDWGMAAEETLKSVRKVKKIKGEQSRLRYLTKEECHALLAHCPDWLAQIVIFALNTGMRKGEILNLKWKDIDMKNGIILLPNTSTKTMQKREIPMNETVKTLLSGLPRQLNPNEKVFKPDVRIREVFEKACRRAGIYDFRFHDLRHTFASHLVMSGVDIQTVSKLLGHTTLTMTLRYAHLSHSHLAQGIKKLDTVFSPKIDAKIANL